MPTKLGFSEGCDVILQLVNYQITWEITKFQFIQTWLYIYIHGYDMVCMYIYIYSYIIYVFMDIVYLYYSMY